MRPFKRVKMLNADEYRVLKKAVASRKIAAGKARACYELWRKSHRNADSAVGLVPSQSPFSAFLSRF